MTPYAKGAAYMGLAMVTPASGWICYKIGQMLDRQAHTSWIAVVGLLVGCGAGIYEIYREALKIEGLDKPKPKDGETENKAK